MQRFHGLSRLLRLAAPGGALLASLASGGSAAAAPGTAVTGTAPGAALTGAAAGAAASLPSVIRPGPGDPSCARPVYPASAQRAGAQGKVVLSYLIALDGAVLDGKISHSSGSPDLDRAAYVALSKCLYRMPAGATEPRWMSATYVWVLQ